MILNDPSFRRMFGWNEIIVERGTHVLLPTRQSYHYQQGQSTTTSEQHRGKQLEYWNNFNEFTTR
jgi:hypothetical protein